MILATSESISGYEIAETFGLVRGNTIRARNIGRDIVALIRNIVGGEVKDYTKMMGEAREQALDRMVAEAESMGADAIVSLRFSTSFIMQGAAELLAYGTAVKLKSK